MRRLFLALYAASGAAALVYEVVWTRLLTLRMGHTVAAASTVLAALMGGLAVGAWAAGAHRRGTPAATLRAYAALEIAAAGCALLLPIALRATVPLLAWAYVDGDAPARFAFVRLTISLVLVGVPAAAMGATFPVAASWYAKAAADAGVLYAANTAGAAAGAIAAGFWLIPAIGLRAATIVGVALNGVAAAGALWIASRAAAVSADPVEVPRNAGAASRAGARRTGQPRRASPPPPAAAPRLAMTAAALSGFVALVYEVAWTRLLALVIGPTTYAFAIVVASVVVGLAIGSSAGARLARRVSSPAAWLAAMLIATAVAASAAAWFAASRLPSIVAAQVSDPAAAFGPIVARQALGIALLLLPMAGALGAVFPLAVASASADPDAIGRDAARVYAWNTVGAIAGSLAGGFALLPAVGLQTTFRAAASIGLLAGVAIGLWALSDHGQVHGSDRVSRGARIRMAAVAALAAAGIAWFLLPPWDLDLLASGAYKYAAYLRPGAFESEVRSWRLAYYRDGAAATVSVRELAGMRSLVIDGKVDASNMGDMLTQRLLGVLPVLLHPHPDDVCVIGLGSGVTVGSALASGAVRRADVVEISPEVVKASGLFARENGNALSAPGVHLIVGDGRSHVLLTARRYDVIVSEPSNPWMAGIAALFTREFFEGARARLKPDGIFCQWAHTYDIGGADLRSIAHTFASAFPQSTMWLVGEGDLLLIGTNGPAIAPHLDGIAQRWRTGTLASLLADVGISDRAAPFALFSMLIGGPAEIAAYGDGAAIQDDDRMALEFSAPRAIYGATTADNAAALRTIAAHAAAPPAARAALDRATDVSWTVAGTMQLKADAHALAYDDFARAVRLNTRNAEALAGLTDAATGAHRLDEERAWLQSLAAAEPANAAVLVELSRLLAAGGDLARAIAAAEDATRMAPGDPRTGEQLASVYADAGDAARLAPLADALVSRFPDRDKPRYYRANALVLSGHAEEAIGQVQAIVDGNPRDVRAQNLLGVACANAGRRACAQAAFEAAVAAGPRDPVSRVNLGVFHLQSGDPAAAAGDFSVALTLDRTSAAAGQGLDEARAALAARR